MGLSGGVAYAVAELVGAGGIVALVALAGERVLEEDGLAVGGAHQDLGASEPRLPRHLREGEVAVVAVQGVVVSGVVGPVHDAEVVVQEVCDVDVEPAVTVHVGACDAGRRAQVGVVSEGGVGDVSEGAVAVVEVEAVPVGRGLDR